MIGRMLKRKEHGLVKTLLLIVIAAILVVAAVVGVTNAVVIKTGGDRIVTVESASANDPQAILVLGASVLPDGSPSGILRDRLDVGIELYLAGVAPKMIMSGDNGTESYNEVLAMKNYALSKGVPSEDVFCDHAGFSTYESMYRAKHVFGVERMVAVTQTYHLYRALYAANGLGIEAVGVSSDLQTYQNQLMFDLREVPARTKDFFKVIAAVPSQFVGDPIDLAGSGDDVE